MEPLYLGIDLGTTSVKLALVSKDGRLQRSISNVTAADVSSSIGSKGSEQDVGSIFTSLVKCIGELKPEEKSSISSVSVTGQMHGVMLWKSFLLKEYAEEISKTSLNENSLSGRTSNLITWQDQRCSPKFLASLPNPDSHLALSTGHGCATLFWLSKHKPEMLQGYDCAGTVMDFLVAALCQRPHPLMTPQLAASWGYFNCRSKQWNKSLMEAEGFPTHLLPEPTDSRAQAGTLQYDWHVIPAGIPVLAALGDMQCAVFSALRSSTCAVLNMSTSCQLSFPIMHQDILPSMPDSSSPVQFFPYFDGSFLAVAASLNCGNVLSNYVAMLHRWLLALGADVDEDTLWQKLLDDATVSVPDDALPLAQPTLYGERHCPTLKGSITNITPNNLDIGAIFRALSKGVVHNVHDMMSASFLEENGVRTLVCSGSLITRNQWVKEEIERCYGGLDIEYGDRCDSAFGAAVIAAERVPKLY